MNSFNAMAQGRAGIRNIQTGGREITRTARGRSMLRLAAYLSTATNSPVTVLATPGLFELQEQQGSHFATPTPATTNSLIPFTAQPSSESQ
jgi:hypothetical protein